MPVKPALALPVPAGTTAATAGWSSAKWCTLVTLVLQNSALVLTMRFGRTRSGHMYLASTAVVCDESIKLVMCLLVLCSQAVAAGEPVVAKLSREVLGDARSWCKVGVVAAVYVIQVRPPSHPLPPAPSAPKQSAG